MYNYVNFFEMKEILFGLVKMDVQNLLFLLFGVFLLIFISVLQKTKDDEETPSTIEAWYLWVGKKSFHEVLDKLDELKKSRVKIEHYSEVVDVLEARLDVKNVNNFDCWLKFVYMDKTESFHLQKKKTVEGIRVGENLVLHIDKGISFSKRDVILYLADTGFSLLSYSDFKILEKKVVSINEMLESCGNAPIKNILYWGISENDEMQLYNINPIQEYNPDKFLNPQAGLLLKM